MMLTDDQINRVFTTGNSQNQSQIRLMSLQLVCGLMSLLWFLFEVGSLSICLFSIRFLTKEFYDVNKQTNQRQFDHISSGLLRVGAEIN
jgi:hypothetical protein